MVCFIIHHPPEFLNDCTGQDDNSSTMQIMVIFVS